MSQDVKMSLQRQTRSIAATNQTLESSSRPRSAVISRSAATNLLSGTRLSIAQRQGVVQNVGRSYGNQEVLRVLDTAQRSPAFLGATVAPLQRKCSACERTSGHEEEAPTKRNVAQAPTLIQEKPACNTCATKKTEAGIALQRFVGQSPAISSILQRKAQTTQQISNTTQVLRSSNTQILRTPATVGLDAAKAKQLAEQIYELYNYYSSLICHGKYCGAEVKCGANTGEAIDQMDNGCKNHDTEYSDELVEAGFRAALLNPLSKWVSMWSPAGFIRSKSIDQRLVNAVSASQNHDQKPGMDETAKERARTYKERLLWLFRGRVSAAQTLESVGSKGLRAITMAAAKLIPLT